MGIGIFISYRRADSGGYSGRLYDSLRGRYGKSFVFLDTASGIPPGKYREFISQSVKNCSILLPVIGSKWASITDKNGNRRLEDPDDLLCEEISSAIANKMLVIPILINNAQMPDKDDLPDVLKPLLTYQAFPARDNNWDDDVKDLCSKYLDGSLPKTPALNASTPQAAVARALLQERQNGAHPFSSCDRMQQWQRLEMMAQNEKQHLAIFLPGDVDQAHLLFLQRVRKLQTENRIILPVIWDDYPQTRTEFVEAIAKVFGCDIDKETEKNLVTELRKHLAFQHIWLLHSPVYLENHSALNAYYTEWFPSLIQAIDPGSYPDWKMRTIKCLQPVGWYKRSQKDFLTKKAYLDLIKKIKKKSSQIVAIRELDELSTITKIDVLQWAEAIGKPDPKAFAERMTREAYTTAQIVQRIVG